MDYVIQVLGYIATICCFSGTVTNIYKKRICFILWIIANLIFIGLNIHAARWYEVLLFVGNTFTAIWGYIAWGK